MGEHEDLNEALYGDDDCRIGRIAVKDWPRSRHEAGIFWASEGKRVLDVGCGVGTVLFNLQDQYEELFGIDLSGPRVERARRNLVDVNKKVSITKQDIVERTDFEDGYFDSVLCLDVIEHVIDIWSMMHEIERILAPGGRLLIATPNIAGFSRRMKLLFGEFPSTSKGGQGLDLDREDDMLDGGHIHYFTFSMLMMILKRIGLEDIRCYGIGRHGKVHNIWPSLFSGLCVVLAFKNKGTEGNE